MMKEIQNTYCLLALDPINEKTVHFDYHHHLYGFPVESDDELFARLVLEINQAGLSWETILKKKDNFYKAYDQFNITKVANYTENDRLRLLENEGIIRNKLKINAAIHNANIIMRLQGDHGSFKNWLDLHIGYTKVEWVNLFKKNFKFTGGEITKEFVISTGYLEGAHDVNCPIYKEILSKNPAWRKAQ